MFETIFVQIRSLLHIFGQYLIMCVFMPIEQLCVVFKLYFSIIITRLCYDFFSRVTYHNIMGSTQILAQGRDKSLF